MGLDSDFDDFTPYRLVNIRTGCVISRWEYLADADTARDEYLADGDVDYDDVVVVDETGEEV